MNCFAGCSFDQICSSLEINPSDLFNKFGSFEKARINENEFLSDTSIDLTEKVRFYSQKHKQSKRQSPLQKEI